MIRPIIAVIGAGLSLSACASQPQPRTAPLATAQAPSVVFFDWDKSSLSPEAMATISQAAAAYRATGSAGITNVGNTDTSGSPDYNMALSIRRADVVTRALIQKGVPAAAIETAGRGQTNLLVPTADGVREPQNRRVELAGLQGQAGTDIVSARVIGIVNTKPGAFDDAAFREVLRTSFDLPYMARAALGTHWNEASDQQRARFLAALETGEVRAYGERLGKLAGFTLTVTKVASRPDGVWTVDSLLSHASGQSIKLEWEARDNGRGLRITDLRIAGVSTSRTRRAEFNSYIMNNGGTVEPLVQELEARAARQ